MSIFNSLKLDHKKKTIIVYPSSYDERYGMDTIMNVWKEGPNNISAFPDQITWLSMLRDYADSRNDMQIVVRIHPREGYRQFGFDSQHLKNLKTIFTENTSTFIIVWPDNPISSYDLMELADICLVGWSSVGHEAARLGIPILSYTANLTYPDDDFIQVATTPEEYKKRLDSMIDMEYTWEHLVKAVRFYHWRTFIPSLDLGETVPVEFKDDTIWPEAPASMVPIINDVLSGKKDLVTHNIKEWQSSLTVDSIVSESKAMQKGIRYFIDKIFNPPILVEKRSSLFLFARRVQNKLGRVWRRLIVKKRYFIKKPEMPFVDYVLKYTNDVSRTEELRQKTQEDSNLRIIIEDGLYTTLVHDGKITRRMSPMIVRLARLHEAITTQLPI